MDSLAPSNSVSAVILAGGQARRMQQQDKGLVSFLGAPLISYPITALVSITGTILISANRNHERYQQWGYPVLSDQFGHFDGPLAGILTALHTVNTDILLVMPCDTPLVTPADLQRLLQALNDSKMTVAAAHDGLRLQPVFLAMRTPLAENLQTFLQGGQRKMQLWLQQQALVCVDFSDRAHIFTNVNSFAELAELEAAAGSDRA